MLYKFSVIAYILLHAYLLCLVYGFSEVSYEIDTVWEHVPWNSLSIQLWSSLNEGSCYLSQIAFSAVFK